MRIVSLTPGTGNFYCGSCLRDHALVKALRKRGHDASMMPMYLPWVVEDEIESTDTHPILFGGINVYLQQKSVLFRRSPKWVDDIFNAPWMLSGAAKRSGMTHASELATLTISMLRGREGMQRKELDKLIDYLEKTGKPDVVALSNGLLAGLTGPIKERLGATVVCSLQGEDYFLDLLPDGDRQQAWEILSKRLSEADAIVATSAYYAKTMAKRLNMDPSRISVVHNGIALEDLSPPPQRGTEPRIGYLARLCENKGLHTLVDAFVQLREAGGHEDAQLTIAGTMNAADEAFVKEQRAKLSRAGLGRHVEVSPNLDKSKKLAFLQQMSILSVPATYGEAFGLYVIEALACGVPFVQPRHGAFPELLEHTGGGILVEPDDPASLAAGLSQLLREPDHATSLGQRGREAVLNKFHADHMARRFEKVCERAAQGSPQAAR